MVPHVSRQLVLTRLQLFIRKHVKEQDFGDSLHLVSFRFVSIPFKFRVVCTVLYIWLCEHRCLVFLAIIILDLEMNRQNAL